MGAKKKRRSRDADFSNDRAMAFLCQKEVNAFLRSILGLEAEMVNAWNDGDDDEVRLAIQHHEATVKSFQTAAQLLVKHKGKLTKVMREMLDNPGNFERNLERCPLPEGWMGPWEDTLHG
jgi:hypothetical protein